MDNGKSDVVGQVYYIDFSKYENCPGYRYFEIECLTCVLSIYIIDLLYCINKVNNTTSKPRRRSPPRKRIALPTRCGFAR